MSDPLSDIIIRGWQSIIDRQESPVVLGVTYVEFDSRGDIPPWAACQIVVRPQADPIIPFRLFVDPRCEAFSIDDVRVGCRSIFQVAQNLSCRPFTNIAGDLDHDGQPFRCEPVLTAMDFLMVVTNRSDSPLRFNATWACRTRSFDVAGDLRQRVTDLEAELTLERQRSQDTITGFQAALAAARKREQDLCDQIPERYDPAPTIEAARAREQNSIPATIDAPSPRLPRPAIVRRIPAGFGWDPHGDD